MNFEEWLEKEWKPFKNNDLFHLKIELRVNTIINVFLFGLLIALLVVLLTNG